MQNANAHISIRISLAQATFAQVRQSDDVMPLSRAACVDAILEYVKTNGIQSHFGDNVWTGAWKYIDLSRLVVLVNSDGDSAADAIAYESCHRRGTLRSRVISFCQSVSTEASGSSAPFGIIQNVLGEFCGVELELGDLERIASCLQQLVQNVQNVQGKRRRVGDVTTAGAISSGSASSGSVLPVSLHPPLDNDNDGAVAVAADAAGAAQLVAYSYLGQRKLAKNDLQRFERSELVCVAEGLLDERDDLKGKVAVEQSKNCKMRYKLSEKDTIIASLGKAYDDLLAQVSFRPDEGCKVRPYGGYVLALAYTRVCASARTVADLVAGQEHAGLVKDPKTVRTYATRSLIGMRLMSKDRFDLAADTGSVSDGHVREQ